MKNKRQVMLVAAKFRAVKINKSQALKLAWVVVTGKEKIAKVTLATEVAKGVTKLSTFYTLVGASYEAKVKEVDSSATVGPRAWGYYTPDGLIAHTTAKGFTEYLPLVMPNSLNRPKAKVRFLDAVGSDLPASHPVVAKELAKPSYPSKTGVEYRNPKLSSLVSVEIED
jgi:hypothetical protein